MEERVNRKMLAGSVIVFFAILFFCLGCTSPGSATPVTATPVTYKEIFIDTYDPTDPTGANGAQYPNYMELWSSDGKTRLAYYDGNNDLRPANEFYAYIDYTGGLTSGDYWVLIKESGTGGADSFGYGIRVLTAQSSVYTGWTL